MNTVAADSQHCSIRFTVPSKPMENQIRCAHGAENTVRNPQMKSAQKPLEIRGKSAECDDLENEVELHARPIVVTKTKREVTQSREDRMDAGDAAVGAESAMTEETGNYTAGELTELATRYRQQAGENLLTWILSLWDLVIGIANICVRGRIPASAAVSHSSPAAGKPAQQRRRSLRLAQSHSVLRLAVASPAFAIKASAGQQRADAFGTKSSFFPSEHAQG
ncbi:unnamed protein product [Ranitomeya imitator]|uniref:Uncharacterized protein n=1 Tax=Ranitomeya imitator TaxID=111125 RepID=A0ABN9MKV2_9NEOB|nr:unnamed protein product [Ranitomeya imitator]